MFIIYVYNVIVNDVCIKNLKSIFLKINRLVCGGKRFYVRCCVYILNIMVRFGFEFIKLIIEKVYDSVDYIKLSEVRFKLFVEIVKIVVVII